MKSDEVIKLSDATRKLGITYHRLFQAIAAGRVPAERSVGGGRWVIRESDMPAIASIMGVSSDNSSSVRKQK